MGLKQCDKCSEMVDEAKAFCPGCGNAFVEEEKRQEASSFERLDSTIGFSQSMYNQMLSDMGLDISKAPDPPEKHVEKILLAEAPAKPPEIHGDKPKPASNTKWFVLGGVLVILVFLLIVLAGALLFMFGRV